MGDHPIVHLQDQTLSSQSLLKHEMAGIIMPELSGKTIRKANGRQNKWRHRLFRQKVILQVLTQNHIKV